MSKKSKKKSLNDYGEIMEVMDVKEYLGIGRDQAYTLMNSGKFHVVEAGRRKLVAREVFRAWLMGT